MDDDWFYTPRHWMQKQALAQHRLVYLAALMQMCIQNQMVINMIINLVLMAKVSFFSARVAGKTEAWSTNFDLYEVPAAGGKLPRNLTAENPAWDAKPNFSPDGRTLAYLAMKRPGFEADRFQMKITTS